MGPRLPGIDDGMAKPCDPGDEAGTIFQENKNKGLSGGEAPYQAQLVLGHGQIVDIPGSFSARFLRQDAHDDISIPCLAQSVIEVSGSIPLRSPRPEDVVPTVVGIEGFQDGVKGLRVGRLICPLPGVGPGSMESGQRVATGSGEQDLAFLGQGEDSIILEENQRLAGGLPGKCVCILLADFTGSGRVGIGILEETEGRRYVGSFVAGEPHGSGQQADPSGVVYSGAWRQGLRHGMGSIDFGDGTSYVGEFRDGLAYDGHYDWGDGRITRSYQQKDGQWRDRSE